MKHLLVFHSEWLYEYRWLDVNREIMFEFNSKFQEFDIIECGAQILTYGTDGSNNDEDEAFEEEDDVQGSEKASKEKDEGIVDGDYKSVSRKRPRKTTRTSASTYLNLGKRPKTIDS
ncbi:unnamed protein product [Arabis nemorensis]|uniref:Uncharacterized protein n=1 Tax=Arabis nemorensis TaxID=586526 RepID=A0A565B4B4_9BRAS|nr:unnamed protein product [Arabis nemorensis]